MSSGTNTSKFLKSISLGIGGFIAIHAGQVAYGSKDGSIETELLEESAIDDFLISLQGEVQNLRIDCFPYNDGESLVLSLGPVIGTEFELKLLRNTMERINLISRPSFLASLVGKSRFGTHDLSSTRPKDSPSDKKIVGKKKPDLSTNKKTIFSKKILAGKGREKLPIATKPLLFLISSLLIVSILTPSALGFLPPDWDFLDVFTEIEKYLQPLSEEETLEQPKMGIREFLDDTEHDPVLPLDLLHDEKTKIPGVNLDTDDTVITINHENLQSPNLPEIPTGLQVDVSDTSETTLTWDESLDKSINDYLIEYKYQDGKFSDLTTTSSLSYVHSNLQDGWHTYRITANNSVGSSLPSDESSVLLLQACTDDNNYEPHFQIDSILKTKDTSYLLFKAEKLIQVRDFEPALMHYEEAILKDCFNADSWIGSGNTLIALGFIFDAKSNHLTAMLLEPNNSNAVIGYGNAFLAEGDLDKASEQYNKAHDMDPENPFALIGLGNIKLLKAQQGNSTYHAAISYFDKVLAVGGAGLADALNGKGNAYFGMKQYENAIDAYSKTLLLPGEKKNADAMLGLGASYIVLGVIHSSLEDENKGIESITKALFLNPKLALDLVYEGDGFSNSNNPNGWKISDTFYKLAISLGDEESVKQAECGSSIIKGNMRASHNFDNPIRTGATSQVFYEAHDFYSEAQSQCNSNSRGTFVLGQFLNRMGSSDYIARYDDAAEENYLDALALFNKILDSEESEDAKVSRNNSLVGLVSVEIRRGNDFIDKQRYDLAEPHYEKASKISPNSKNVNNAFQYLYYEMGMNFMNEYDNCTEAIVHFQRVLDDFNPIHKKALDAIGDAEEKLNLGTCS